MKILIKIIVSIALIILIVWKFPISKIIANLQNVKFGWLLLCFLISELVIVSQAFRWHYLLIVPKEQKY